MKAIYLNIDPYLQAFADWLAAGKPGDKPKFSPLPVAVTIPLGVDAGYLSPLHSGDPQSTTINGQTVYFSGPDDTPISTNVQIAGLSALAPSAYYSVEPISGSSVDVEFIVSDGDAAEISFTIPVLVRREQAQGPVDLVDFTPPAAAGSAFIADQCGFDSALRAADFSGVALFGADACGIELFAATFCGMPIGTETAQTPDGSQFSALSVDFH